MKTGSPEAAETPGPSKRELLTTAGINPDLVGLLHYRERPRFGSKSRSRRPVVLSTAEIASGWATEAEMSQIAQIETDLEEPRIILEGLQDKLSTAIAGLTNRTNINRTLEAFNRFQRAFTFSAEYNVGFLGKVTKRDEISEERSGMIAITQLGSRIVAEKYAGEFMRAGREAGIESEVDPFVEHAQAYAAPVRDGVISSRTIRELYKDPDRRSMRPEELLEFFVSSYQLLRRYYVLTENPLIPAASVEQILRKQINPDDLHALAREFPNMAIWHRVTLATGALALTELDDRYFRSVKQYYKGPQQGLAQESAEVAKKLTRHTRELKEQIYKALLDQTEAEHSEALRRAMGRYLGWRSFAEEPALRVAQMDMNPNIEEAYRRALELSSNRKYGRFYKNLANSLARQARRSGVLTHDDLEDISVRRWPWQRVSRSTSENSLADLGKAVDGLQATTGKRIFVYGEESALLDRMPWTDIIKPTSVTLEIDSSTPRVFATVYRYYNGNTGEEIELTYFFDTQSHEVDWDLLEPLSSRRFGHFLHAAIDRSAIILGAALQEAQAERAEKRQVEITSRASRPSLREQRLREGPLQDDPVYLRASGRIKLGAVDASQTQASAAKPERETQLITHRIIFPDKDEDPDGFRDLFRGVPWMDRDKIVKAVENINQGGSLNNFLRCKTGKGIKIYRLRVGRWRLLVQLDEEGQEGLMTYHPFTLGRRKDVFRDKGLSDMIYLSG